MKCIMTYTSTGLPSTNARENYQLGLGELIDQTSAACSQVSIAITGMLKLDDLLFDMLMYKHRRSSY